MYIYIYIERERERKREREREGEREGERHDRVVYTYMFGAPCDPTLAESSTTTRDPDEGLLLSCYIMVLNV